ncbi:MAG: HAD family hydrolase [Chloroflexota bacterium]
MPLRAIVFDLWGTLLTERRAVFPERAQMRFDGVAAILRRHGIDPTIEEFTERHRESMAALSALQEEGRDVTAEERARHVIERFDPALPDRVPEGDIDAFIEAYGGPIVQTPPELLPGALEVIEEARARGFAVGLISNTGVSGGRHLRPVLEAHGLLEHFDVLLFSDELRQSKPHPGIFEAALEALGATADEAVFVGDTPRYDVGPPRQYGWWVVQVGDRDDGDPPAHVRVPGVGDLFPALDSLGLLDDGSGDPPDLPGAPAASVGEN